MRWTPQNKSLSLTFLHSGPKAYRIMRNIFRMPTIKTLKNSLKHLQVYPGFNENFLCAFQHKVEAMTEQSKVCALVVDEMSIKECTTYDSRRDEIEGLEDFGSAGRSRFVANHATVFMVRGLSTKWKQPLAYFLSSGPVNAVMLKTLTLQCIDKVKKIGLCLKVMICDQGSNNRSALHTHLGVTPAQPFFHHKEERIIVMYDPPHLVKSIRNNFRNHGFKVGDAEVKWTSIEELYAVDSKLPIRMVPKLTQRHVTVPPFSHLRCCWNFHLRDSWYNEEIIHGGCIFCREVRSAVQQLQQLCPIQRPEVSVRTVSELLSYGVPA